MNRADAVPDASRPREARPGGGAAVCLKKRLLRRESLRDGGQSVSFQDSSNGERSIRCPAFFQRALDPGVSPTSDSRQPSEHEALELGAHYATARALFKRSISGPRAGECQRRQSTRFRTG